MENNNLLPVESKKSVFNKIKNIFNSIFNKKPKIDQVNKEMEKLEEKSSKKVSFMESLKENTDIESASDKDTIEYIVKKVEENPDLLDNLTIKNLEKVRDYYADKIKDVERAIISLK